MSTGPAITRIERLLARRRRRRSALAAILLTATMLVGLASAATAHEGGHDTPDERTFSSAVTYNANTEYRWKNPRTFCIQSNLGSGWTSQKAAVNEFRTISEFNVVYKTGTNACKNAGWAKRIILVKGSYNTRCDGARACVDVSNNITWGRNNTGEVGWILKSPVYVRINTSYPKSRTWQQNKMTILHELTHAVMSPLGSGWNGGHTSRCDSVMSNSFNCLHKQTGLTKYDRATIARVYKDWR